jgi:hypothetical protein
VTLGIAERGTSTLTEQREEAARVAIRTVASKDARNCTASGGYGLEDRCREMISAAPG